MRLDRQTESLHYFHIYAVENRIDFSMLSDVSLDKSSINDLSLLAKSLLPTELDDQKLKANISTLITRVLCTHVDFFKLCFDGIIDWHIKHQFYEEMSRKSVVVSAIILMCAYYFSMLFCVF